jgi:hypothetical protein
MMKGLTKNFISMQPSEKECSALISEQFLLSRNSAKNWGRLVDVGMPINPRGNEYLAS